ncbi:MAG: sterol desaturase family protein [Proteobacteria bacterium]|nr:sterol desaturase family protein [Pseudomonadota bacterium]
MRRAARVLVFPAALVAAFLGARAAFAAGLPPSSVLAAISAVTLVLVTLGERWLPVDPDWNRSRGDLATDVAHSVLTSFVWREAVKIALVAALLPVAIAMAASLDGGLWPDTWPLAAQVGLAALVGEFGHYWAHRLAHERPWLWRLHATHHSPERLYWLNAGRDHPLGLLWTVTASFTPLVLLGASAECLTLLAVLETVVGLFQHANLDTRLGPLNWIFSLSELHRWHHSRLPYEAGHNYGANLIVWDAVFGTRYLPRRRAQPQALGLQDLPAFPTGYWAQLRSPFRGELWQRDGSRS